MIVVAAGAVAILAPSLKDPHLDVGNDNVKVFKDGDCYITILSFANMQIKAAKKVKFKLLSASRKMVSYKQTKVIAYPCS